MNDQVGQTKLTVDVKGVPLQLLQNDFGVSSTERASFTSIPEVTLDVITDLEALASHR